MLSKKDTIRLAKLKEYYTVWGILPTCNTAAELAGFNSKAAAYKFYQRLIGNGFFGRTPDKRFYPTNKFHEISL